MSEKQTFWSSKYALTQGIERIDGCETRDVGGGRRYATRGINTAASVILAIGRDAHPTEAEAIERAIALCEARQKALRKQALKVADAHAGFVKRLQELRGAK